MKGRILIAIVIVGVFSILVAYMYFTRDLIPNAPVPNKCTLPHGVECEDFAFSSQSDIVTMSIRNELGNTMNVQRISLIPESPGIPSCSKQFGIEIENSTLHDFVIVCKGLNKSEARKRYKLSVEWFYVNQGQSYNRTWYGEILSPIN